MWENLNWELKTFKQEKKRMTKELGLDWIQKTKIY